MKFDRHILVRLFGIRGALLHGDPMVADRWRFLKKRLPRTRGGEHLLDVGCGSAAFTIGAAKRGYRAVGLSWDKVNQKTANDRAAICAVSGTDFPIQDVRRLNERPELEGRFDVVVNFENIEHIINDQKLMRDIANVLKPGERLLMTSPNFYYRPLSKNDTGPFLPVEDGGHVRRGYTSAMLQELCDDSGLIIEEITSCSGLFSQKITQLDRVFGWAGMVIGMPLRILPPLLDPLISRLTRYPNYSICMVAYKPRFGGGLKFQEPEAGTASSDAASRDKRNFA